MYLPQYDVLTNAKERLIVALDLADVEAARKMVQQLKGAVDFFKIGLALQLAEGVRDFILELIADGNRVFLDYKYYDIPETLKKSVARAATLGVHFLTVHGSSALIKAAVEGRGSTQLKLFTVTVLTNWDKDDLSEMGYTRHTVEEVVLFRAQKALEAGCDGVITSGREARAVRDLSKNLRRNLSRELLIVTPGIRPDGYAEDDQKRRTTPKDAILAGADYLVIGRPITDAGDPLEAARRILSQIQDALDSLHQSTPL